MLPGVAGSTRTTRILSKGFTNGVTNKKKRAKIAADRSDKVTGISGSGKSRVGGGKRWRTILTNDLFFRIYEDSELALFAP